MDGWDGGVDALPEVDPQQPSATRIYDFLLGGVHNFAADRQAAAAALAAMPDLLRVVRVNRDFLCRAVTFAARAGIDQFLDLGAGIPAGENVRDVARRVRPGARVVAVDVDPVAVVHTRQLLAGDPDAAVLAADLTDADAVLAAEPVRRLLDLDRPVCVLVLATADFIPDTERLGRALDRYREAMAPGSLLVLSHGTGEGDAEQAEQVRRVYNTTTSPLVLRDRDDIRALLGDWPLAEPGLSTAAQWRPGTGEPPAEGVAGRTIVVAAARKPGASSEIA